MLRSKDCIMGCIDNGCIEGVSRGASRCASRGSGIVRGNVVRGQGFSRLGVGEGEGVEGELVGGGC